MSAREALLWYLERVPELRSTTGALVILDRTPSRSALRDVFEDLCAQLVRMRQRVIEVPCNLAPPEWAEDPRFDLDYHVRHLAVPAPGTMADLLEAIGPLYATPLDRARPLWEVYAAEGLVNDRGALLVKLHRCLTGAVSGARVLERLAGESGEPVAARAAGGDVRRSTSRAAVLWRAKRDNLAAVITAGVNAGSSLMRTLGRPAGSVARMGQRFRSAGEVAKELLQDRLESPLQFPPGLSHRLSTFELPVADIEAVRASVGSTTNDVLLTIVCGALHRWHTSRGTDVHELRALVSRGTAGTGHVTPGSEIEFFRTSLPVGEPNPLRRLQTVQAGLGACDGGGGTQLYPLLARVLAALPLDAVVRLWRRWAGRADVVYGSAAGPQQPLHIAGAKIEQIYPYGPRTGYHPLAVAFYSYCGTMYVGLDIDPRAMADLPHFLDALRESATELINVSSPHTAPAPGLGTGTDGAGVPDLDSPS